MPLEPYEAIVWCFQPLPF